MTTAMSKRNQARNEKALQELLRTVAGNDRCADCSARNPGWASWSLGIFICMRCAAIHRKLGTHISKVKSLSMDSWTNDQVESMRKIGNVNSNKIWNPQNRQPFVPIDVDEIDGAVEKFIRQKYVQRVFAGGNAPAMASPSIQDSSEAGWNPQKPSNSRDSREKRDQSPPAPQPSKPSKKFGFGLRSASSTFHLGKPKGRERKGSLPTGRVVGATIGIKEDELGWKLVTLKEMGFDDEKRNTEILKGLNGDLERTIESLVRLGQGPADDLGLRKQISKNVDKDPNRFPQPPERSGSKPLPPHPQSAGITGLSIQQSPQTTGLSGVQSSASSPGLRKQSNNPFDMSHMNQAPQGGLEQAFGSMTIATPLSTQSTGILPSQQPLQQTIYQQSMTPPPTGGFQQPAYNPYLQQHQQLQMQAAYQPIQPQMTGNNPFMQSPMQTPGSYGQLQSQPLQTSPNPYLQNQSHFQQQQQQPSSPHNPFLQQANTGAYGSNYQVAAAPQPQYSSDAQFFSQSPTTYQAGGNQSQQNPFFQQVQQQSFEQQQQQQQQFLQQFSQPQQQNPYAQVQQQQMLQQQQAQQFLQPQMQPLAAQPTGRMNKQSIMALYNQPSQPSIPEDQVAPSTTPTSPAGQPNVMAGNMAVNRRSVTMPIMSTGTNNPFGAAVGGGGGAAAAQGQPAPGASARDSIFLDGASDPFASLSARFA